MAQASGNSGATRIGSDRRRRGCCNDARCGQSDETGSDFTVMFHADRDGGRSHSYAGTDKAREQFYDLIMQQMRRGVIREFKRLVCFDPDVLANDHELQSGILHSVRDPEPLIRLSRRIAG